MIKFFRSDFGLFVLLNVGFVAGLLGASGVVIGGAIWFTLFVLLGYFLVTEKKTVATGKTTSGGGGGGSDVELKDTDSDVYTELDVAQ